METTVQSLDDVDQKLVILLNNRNRSCSGVYKALRRDGKISMVGDYPLLSFVIRRAFEITNTPLWNRLQVSRAVSYTDIKQELGQEQFNIPIEWEQYIKH